MRKLSMRQRKSMSQKRRTEDRPIPKEKSELIDESNEEKLKSHLNKLDNELLQLSDISVSCLSQAALKSLSSNSFSTHGTLMSES